MQITLGVTGGVAAYKAAELVRRLQQEGFSVEVVMTRAACAFVRPLTFAALSGKKVITDLFAESGGEANLESAIEVVLATSPPYRQPITTRLAHQYVNELRSKGTAQ